MVPVGTSSLLGAWNFPVSSGEEGKTLHGLRLGPLAKRSRGGLDLGRFD